MVMKAMIWLMVEAVMGQKENMMGGGITAGAQQKGPGRQILGRATKGRKVPEDTLMGNRFFNR